MVDDNELISMRSDRDVLVLWWKLNDVVYSNYATRIVMVRVL